MLLVQGKRLTELLAAHLSCMCKHIFDAVIGKQQLCCSLCPYARHPRDIIRAVSHQTFHINQPDGWEAILLLESCGIIVLHIADAFFR